MHNIAECELEFGTSCFAIYRYEDIVIMWPMKSAAYGDDEFGY